MSSRLSTLVWVMATDRYFFSLAAGEHGLSSGSKREWRSDILLIFSLADTGRKGNPLP